MLHYTRQPAHTGYVSEFEQFMGKFLDEHPAVIRSQRDGWTIFWDHDIDPDDLVKANQDTVPVKPYSYD
ncbi:MAG: DUF3460 family protein [Burkholderiaceae bacterium]